MTRRPMNGNPLEGRTETAGAMLDELRAHPEWSDRERDFHLGRLVERFASEQVVEAVQVRLADLSQPDAESLLRLVEANPIPSLARALGAALFAQPDLPAERAWSALAVLDAVGLLDEFPELQERWDDLNEALDDEGSLAQLVEQISGDPDGVWLALQGLGGVEPEVRAQIIEGVGRSPIGEGVVEFLRLLAYSHDPLTRAAAVDALHAQPAPNPAIRAALRDLAENHPDQAIAAAARGQLATYPRVPVAAPASRQPVARELRSIVTAVDGHGVGSVVLGAVAGQGRATAAFSCDVIRGVIEVIGDIAADHGPNADATFDSYLRMFERDLVEDAHSLALSVLAGSVLLSGPATPLVLQYWLEATAGSAFRARPFRAELPGWEPASVPNAEMPRRAEAVLGSCPDWIDASPLTYQIAEELLLRAEGPAPDPTRDAGAYRYLFEHRLRSQLEGYRRMLLWMTGFWQAAGDLDLARSALAIAWQLSDAQHVVPGHPFTVALSTRSLASAQADLRRGVDPRR